MAMFNQLFANVLTVCVSLAISIGVSQGAEWQSFFKQEDRASVNVYTHLQQVAYQALDQRLERLGHVKTPQLIKSYQQQHRESMVKGLGGFPERSPLNSRQVGVLEVGSYQIEKVIFDSRPRHRITANLYLPKQASADDPVPGICVSSGHSRTAKTADYNQRFGAMFATHGMAALVFDPIGQGERAQILNKAGGVQFGGTTTEHMLIGVGSTLVGLNTATYRIWDGMRAIDYLVSRPEIDSDRIGYTGCSGGGTLTSYVMALDDRVTCAAPACYLTTFRRLIETIGPQDAEQNLFAQLIDGLDQPDYVLMRSPKPTLISSTTQDFFDIDGSWDNFRQAKQIYGRLGFSERVDLVEIEGNHGVQPEGLATITQWMKRWLMGVDEPVDPIDLTLQQPSDLLCTETGQVLTSLKDEKSVIDLNHQRSQMLAERRRVTWTQQSNSEKRQTIRRVINFNSEVSAEPRFIERGVLDLEVGDLQVGMLVTKGRQIPAAVIRQAELTDRWCILLHDGGIEGGLADEKMIGSRFKSGANVMMLDLAGQGLTSTAKPDATLTDWKTFYLAYLLGESILGLQVKDLIDAAAYVGSDQNISRKKDRGEEKVELIASGKTGLVALHAAAITDRVFSRLTLSQLPVSWSEVVGLNAPEGMLDSSVHGVLENYDWPDLVELIGSDRVVIQ